MTNYQVVSAIGKGSFGEVMLATQKTTGKSVAIKHIPNVFKDEYHTRKILSEI